MIHHDRVDQDEAGPPRHDVIEQPDLAPRRWRGARPRKILLALAAVLLLGLTVLVWRAGGADEPTPIATPADWSHPTPLYVPLTGHTDWVWAVVFSPDGRTLATGGVDQTVRFWNVADHGNPVLLDQPLAAHTERVVAIAFSPDGHTLASGSEDHTVQLWKAG